MSVCMLDIIKVAPGSVKAFWGLDWDESGGFVTLMTRDGQAGYRRRLTCRQFRARQRSLARIIRGWVGEG